MTEEQGPEKVALRWQWSEMMKNPDLTMGLSATDHHVAVVLSLYADVHTGVCWPSQKELREVCHLGRTSIIDSLKALQELGWVKKLSRGQMGKGTNHYQLTLPDGTNHRTDGSGTGEGHVLHRDPTTGETHRIPVSELAELKQREEDEAYERLLQTPPKSESSVPKWKQREMYERELAEEGFDSNGQWVGH